MTQRPLHLLTSNLHTFVGFRRRMASLILSLTLPTFNIAWTIHHTTITSRRKVQRPITTTLLIAHEPHDVPTIVLVILRFTLHQSRRIEREIVAAEIHPSHQLPAAHKLQKSRREFYPNPLCLCSQAAECSKANSSSPMLHISLDCFLIQR
ncbi:hypothetical protein BKA61DRAFT_623682 [Leptodontidium sp. MPI-SDFR-AT-0119]|nr:hypothetical protein BKA61DRAFT_623682 [Leptodontidium sp. MPI-SDFR-AT-0119]